MLKITLILLNFCATVFCQNCSAGNVRLVKFNAYDSHAGIVEVCNGNVWGTICTDSLTNSWSLKNAHIACWNAGYSGALNSIVLSTLPKSYQVSQEIPIHYKSMVCSGIEQTFAACVYSTNTTGCTHDYDAAVVCKQSNSAGDVRLVGSPYDGTGVVEMYFTDYNWVRLCPSKFDLSSVCNKLGYTSTFVTTSSESSNRAGLSKLSTITVCTTTYSYYYYTYYTYSSYYHSSTSHSYSGIKSYQKCTTQYTTSSSSCSYAQDTYASVVCSNLNTIQGSVRLTGGVYSNAVGNVEVFYNGVWGSVCSTGWNADAGRVVCAQLGYDPSKFFTINPSTSGFTSQSYSKPIWLTNVNNCSYPTNNKILQCGYTPPIGYGQGCSGATIATLQCEYALTTGAIAGIAVGLFVFFVLCGTLIGVGIFCLQTGRCIHIQSWIFSSRKLNTTGNAIPMRSVNRPVTTPWAETGNGMMSANELNKHGGGYAMKDGDFFRGVNIDNL